MKNILNHVLVIVFLFFTTNVYSNPIEKINFIGLNNTTENTLLKEIPVKIGDIYSDSASNKIIQSLFQTGLFSDISVSNSEGNLNITLVENPTIKFFDQSGKIIGEYQGDRSKGDLLKQVCKTYHHCVRYH